MSYVISIVAHSKNFIPLVPIGSALEQVEEEYLIEDRLTQVHLEKWPLNGSFCLSKWRKSGSWLPHVQLEIAVEVVCVL